MARWRSTRRSRPAASRARSAGSGCTSPPRPSSSRSAPSSTCTELAVEDAIHAHQRPKLEVFGDMVFIVLKTARYVDSTEIIQLGEILIFLGHDYIITVRHGEASELKEVRERLEQRSRAARARSGRRAPCDRRPRGRRLQPGDPRARRGHRRGRGRGLLRPAQQPRGAHLQAQARGARVQPCLRPAGRPRRPPRPRPLRGDPPGGAGLLPRRERPPAARARAARGLPRSPDERARGEPRPGDGAPERGRAQDLGDRRDHCRPNGAWPGSTG